MKVKLFAKHCGHTDYSGEVEISKVYKALFIIMFISMLIIILAIYVVLGLIACMMARSGF